jgi:DNA-binding MarR family transcriptional regulator
MPTPDTESALITAMAASLEVSLTRVFRPFRRELILQDRAHGLTQAQHTALRLLSGNASRRMSEIADYLDLTNSAATALVEKLVERGLVERHVDAHDKRAVLVALSPAGADLIEAIKVVVRRRMAELLARMSPAERYMALGGVEALAGTLEAEAGV